ncbi:MAG: CAP domain-containing protein [Chloroflexi bacterium]|nr:CAP domain-containing protein [Chloroflexota bacterium]
MSPGGSESERQRALRKTKGLGTAKSIPLAIALVGIVGAVLAIGYFLSESRTEEISTSNIPIEPVDSEDASTVAPATSADTTSTTFLERGSPEWITTIESAVHQLVNFERQKDSLSVLSQDPELAEIARAHSKDMALNDYFEHENLAGLTAADRGIAVGYRCLKDFGSFYTEGISENIFQGWFYSSFNPRGRNYMTLEELAFEIVDDWMNSPEHRQNILTETYDREGIGVGIGAEESVWVTQNFC